MTRGRRLELNLYERAFRRHHNVAYVPSLAVVLYDTLLEGLALSVKVGS